MNYYLDTNDRPFTAIKNGTKKIEGRVPTSWDKIPYSKLLIGDILIFRNNSTDETLSTEVLGVRHYSDTQSMLEKEGITRVLSLNNDISGAVESYNNHPEYKENIPKFGIYAIEIKVIS